MLKKVKTMISDKSYKKKYGVVALKNRETVEEMMEMVLKQKEQLSAHRFNDYHYWEWNLRTGVLDGKVSTTTLFHGTTSTLKYLKESGIDLSNYDWLCHSTISMETIPNMISFQICLSQLYEQVKYKCKIIEEMNSNGIETSNHSVLIELDVLIQEGVTDLERILNPVTRIFYDEASKEKILNERLNDKLKEFKQKSLLIADASVVQAHQMESIRQLETVLSNEDVSDETKQKAKATIKEIEENIAQQEKLKRKEEAEMEAHSIIEASLLVHQLKQV